MVALSALVAHNHRVYFEIAGGPFMSAHDPTRSKTLLVERDGAVASVTINRPGVLNALSSQTLDELHQDDRWRSEMTRRVRVVVITGAGEKAFVAGADINELAEQSPTSGRDHAIRGQQVFDLDRDISASR